MINVSIFLTGVTALNIPRFKQPAVRRIFLFICLSYVISTKKIPKPPELSNMNTHKAGASTSNGPEKPHSRPQRQRWTNPDNQPLKSWAQLPQGWNIDEPDLDPQDLSAQIERCKERIEENIMPYIFEIRLKVLEKAKASRE